MMNEQVLNQRIRAITPEAAENQMNSLRRELDDLRAEILKNDRTKPDAKLLLKGKSAIQHFEVLAVAATRMRTSWPNAGQALDALEAWRKDWNVVASAALVHTKLALTDAEHGTPEYDRALKTLLELVDLVGATFRPLTGPTAKWLNVQAEAVDKTSN